MLLLLLLLLLLVLSGVGRVIVWLLEQSSSHLQLLALRSRGYLPTTKYNSFKGKYIYTYYNERVYLDDDIHGGHFGEQRCG